ncbi:MAG TPA: dihydrolipoamide acetyltransferase family protein [Stellaceae bacterium]|nr:dihydrolipoamide acetyltransferase family protein [Stellaceae bacterium]
MAEFRMPSLGADMEAGTLVEWLKKPGDRIVRGDIIAVVETQKGAIEIEVFQSGTLETLLATPGQKVAVGFPMAFIRGDGERDVTLPAVPTPPQAWPTPQAAPPSVTPHAAVPPPHLGAIRASPAARKRAAELGVELQNVGGTGAGGAITLADIEKAAAALPSPGEGMRQAIGAAMARSKREIPHYYLAHTADLEPALRWLEAENAKRPPPERVLYGVLLLKAVARALRDYPEFNGFWINGRFQPSASIHLGVAISIGKSGLVAPAIHDADGLALPQLMAALRDLVARARKGGLRSSELTDPTITVTSLGERSVESVFPVIYPPQVAIAGFGMVVERPWVVESAVVPRRVLSCSLAGDHRVSDGHRGARFLAAVARLLQEPQGL